MALQLYLGCAGSGKSHKLYEHIIAESLKHPELNYYILVPEQYNLSTQQKLISMHPKKGILNIDVLSFTRLAHRVFEEVGYSHARGATIDDIGKNLILRHMAGRNEDRLTALKGSVGKLGYISEVKSVISEFMQYGIGDKELSDLIAKSEGRGILKQKLTDIRLLYNEFLKYINEKYITTEEILQKVRDEVPRSKKLKKTVIVLDGYTGYTPVQRGLIEALLINCIDVYVTLLMDTYTEADILQTGDADEQELFYLSRKTIASLEKICRKNGVARKEDVIIRDPVPARFMYDDKGDIIPKDQQKRELIHLEKNLFRAGEQPFIIDDDDRDGRDGSVSIFTGTMPDEEAVEAAVRIERLIRDKGYHYKDIAVVTGDIATYMNACARAFLRYDIPFFVDKTKPVMLNPMIEYIRALFEIVVNDHSYEAMFRYLRTSVCGYDTAKVDILENYVLRYGIKGRKAWGENFIRKPKDMGTEELELINELRDRIYRELDGFVSEFTDSGHSNVQASAVFDVKHVSTALYRFIHDHELQAKMDKMSESFEEEGDGVRAMEYRRIYEEVCDLLDKIVRLMPGERMTLKEYADILDAGFAEIRTGVLPGSDDYVQIGDITRTRLRDVRAIFFMGVNDGIIPAAGGNGGIISDMEREFLTDRPDASETAGIELAPTARMKAYDQRLYLYMLTTKPTQKLYVSYSKLSTDGDSVNPSYFVKQLLKMFPNIKVEQANESAGNRVYGYKSGGYFLARGIQDLLAGMTDEKKADEYLELLGDCLKDEGYKEQIRGLMKGALSPGMTMGKDSISSALAAALYGSDLKCSITRLETYAKCAYRHFLKYGLSLKEREIFSFEAKDLGSVFHDAIKEYAGILRERNLPWTSVDEDMEVPMIDEAIERCIAGGEYEAMYGSFRTQYTVNRMRRIVRRTVDVLTDHLKRGSFTPYDHEFDFETGDDIKLYGRVDRMDLCTGNGTTYVKIIDYKSGNKDFDLVSIYAGLDLQLVVYMNAGMDLISRKQPGEKVIPAGIFYYHIDDPIIKDEEVGRDGSDEEIDEKIREQLRMSGLVNSDEAVYRLMDNDFGSRSSVIPVSLKKDGEFSTYSSVASAGDFEVISDYVNQKIGEFEHGIVNGNIKTNPCTIRAYGVDLPCAYCDYSDVCGYRGEGVVVNRRTIMEGLDEDEQVTVNGRDSVINAMKKCLNDKDKG